MRIENELGLLYLHIGNIMCPNIVVLGEPLLEFNARQLRRLKDNLYYEVGFAGNTSNVP